MIVLPFRVRLPYLNHRIIHQAPVAVEDTNGEPNALASCVWTSQAADRLGLSAAEVKERADVWEGRGTRSTLLLKGRGFAATQDDIESEPERPTWFGDLWVNLEINRCRAFSSGMD